MDKPFTIFLTILTIVCIIFFIYKSWTQNHPDVSVLSLISKAEAKAINADWLSGSLKIIKDADYGCEYITRTTGGITPRMTSEGKHAGCNDNITRTTQDN